MTNKKLQALQEIATQVKICQKCRLCKTAIQGVPGAGNPESEIVFIGEAPGHNEDMQGIPFVGRAGKLLEFMLGQIGYKREDVWIGNIIKHRPPDNRDPLPDEIDACQPYLTKQLEIIAPKLVVTLGRFAMNYFLTSATITTAHGKPLPLTDYIVYPLYHPAAGLRNGKVKAELIKDFLKIPEIMKMDKSNVLYNNLNTTPIGKNNSILPTDVKETENGLSKSKKQSGEQIELI